MWKTTTNFSAAGNLYQVRMGPNSNTKSPETHDLDAQMSSKCLEKNIFPTILRPAAGITFEMNSFCA